MATATAGVRAAMQIIPRTGRQQRTEVHVLIEVSWASSGLHVIDLRIDPVLSTNGTGYAPLKETRRSSATRKMQYRRYADTVAAPSRGLA